jgi:hypothetical protein
MAIGRIPVKKSLSKSGGDPGHIVVKFCSFTDSGLRFYCCEHYPSWNLGRARERRCLCCTDERDARGQ